MKDTMHQIIQEEQEVRAILVGLNVDKNDDDFNIALFQVQFFGSIRSNPERRSRHQNWHIFYRRNL